MKIRAFREECPFFIFKNRFFEGEALTVAKAASPSNFPPGHAKIICFTQNEDYVLEWCGKDCMRYDLWG